MISEDEERRRVLERAALTGGWLKVIPSWLNGTELSTEEFQDNLCIRYCLEIRGLNRKCDGCGKVNDLRHALKCKKGGLIIARHNEIRDEVDHLARKGFLNVWTEPKMYPQSLPREAYVLNRRTDNPNLETNIPLPPLPLLIPPIKPNHKTHTVTQNDFTEDLGDQTLNPDQATDVRMLENDERGDILI